jgi:ribosomal-protein-alanine N-acetyltransferase
MTPQHDLRPALASDLDAIESLERATEYAPHWPRSAYAAIISASDAAPIAQTRCLITAHSDGQLTGFAVGLLHPAASQPASRITEIETVAVAATARRAGIGRALCVAILAWSRSNGATEATLEVRAASTPAIKLYISLGFEQTGRRPRYYRDPTDDALLMHLKLQPTSPPDPSSSPA